MVVVFGPDAAAAAAVVVVPLMSRRFRLAVREQLAEAGEGTRPFVQQPLLQSTSTHSTST